MTGMVKRQPFFIELTMHITGKRIILNTRHIVSVKVYSKGGCSVALSHSIERKKPETEEIFVQEKYQVVRDMLRVSPTTLGVSP